MFVLWGENTQQFKANLREVSVPENLDSDFSWKILDQEIIFSNTKEIWDLVQISFSLAYDDTILELNDFISTDTVEITTFENSPWFVTYIIVFSSPQNISKNTDIIKIPFTRNENTTVHMNPVNVNFTDSQWTVYSLSSSWMVF